MKPDILEALRQVAVPTLSAVMFARGLRSRFLHGIVPANPEAARFIGPAYTIRAIPVREDLRDAVAAGRLPNLHRQIFSGVPAGAVLVCATGGAAHVSVLGDIIATALHRKGVAGVVVDTGVSDLPVVAAMTLPVHHGGGSAPVPSSAAVMVVDHSLPIGIAGVAVFPGDIIVGDASGVVCIPAELVEEVAREAAEKERLEAWILAQIEGGAPLEGTYPPDAATKARYRAAQG
ncbi:MULTISPECIES: RraA family protein [Roseomonadaceae]|uniref:Ribonuclease activity regulator RraA n=1 Tax=Falsiroseomonas oleicola TaxID=2801474 RepID=A0ABS6HEP2_9PROT|nr:ribonuclease activity regulator RraA [Roseomonas oleicola]MBU8547164.1 ribonuclease activity regulator RraA [Roseomonas oleicola]